MSSQSPQQQWSLVYYRKKYIFDNNQRAQFNQYIQFKTKSFQYQKLLSKLHFLSNDDKQTQQKNVKQLIKGLNSNMEEMKNIFSQIHQEMKFLKLENLASLIEGVQQLVISIHHYTIEDFKNKIQYGQSDREKQDSIDTNTCKKCLGSINQLNLKKLYDQITTTQSSVQDDTATMTKQDRRKLIRQLDEYDILLAEKQNYLRKVNAVLQSKGKVGQLSNHDKTYNFLSQYLSKIQKIQQRRNKTYNKTGPSTQAEDRKWQEESYKHILEYIKRVLFQHFVNECSGPVKKMFQNINIDKLFKSFTDHQNDQRTWKSQATMENHQTQTINIPQVQQLKMVERKMQFKVKQISMLKSNKDELQKKYLSTLDLNRKVESDMFQAKKQRKWYQSELKISQQNLKKLNQKYEQAVKNYQQDQRRTIERYINERQRILRASKIMETDFMALEEEHKKCMRMRNVAKEYANQESQTYLLDFPDQQQQGQFSMIRKETSPLKRRRSKMNKMLFTSISGERKNGVPLKDIDKGTIIFQAQQNDTISEKDQKESKAGIRLYIQSQIVDMIISPFSEDEHSENNQMKIQKRQLKQHKSMTRLNKQKSYLRQNGHQMTQRMLTQGNDTKQVQNLVNNNKHIKMSMKSFKKQKKYHQLQQTYNITNNQKLSPYKFSNFDNRFTQTDQKYKSKNINTNLTSPELFSQIDRRQTEINQYHNNAGYIVSERLYSQRKRKESKQLPFERVIENGKEKFYIKKISRESMNYKVQKEKIKQISQILKPYVYNNNSIHPSPPKKTQSHGNLKSIRQRLSWLGQKKSPDAKCNFSHQKHQNIQQENYKQQQKTPSITAQPVKHIGHDIVSVQHIIQSQYAYLKAVGFIDFLMKIGKENKKIVKTINKIENQVEQKFRSPSQSDLELFGGRHQAQDYIRGKNFWILDDVKENMMIYNKNDGLSLKIQKYFTLLKRANPELYGVLVRFLIDPIFAVCDKKVSNQEVNFHHPEDSNFIRDLFNQLQKYHKIKHNQCTHIYDFLQKIGFYKYTYF